MVAEPIDDVVKQGRNEIADLIRFEIMSGKLQFGEKINENRYTSLFGVSRTPVREAALLLASLGLIEIKPRSGTYVTTFTETSLRQLFEVRRMLEEGGVRLSSGTKRKKLVTCLEKLFERMEAEKGKNDELKSFHSSDTEFHAALVAAAENPRLINMYQPIGACAQAARSRLNETKQIAITAQNHHAMIIDTIRQNDIDGFSRILDEHLTWVLGSLMMVDELFERK